MLTFAGRDAGRFCDGLTRRNFLRIGSLAGVAALPTVAAAGGLDGGLSSPDDGAVIMVYLPGGPTQHETFDPKPLAPVEIRGSYQSIPTRTPGIHFCELLPRLAAISDQFSVVRTLVGMANRHESFQCYTGRPGGRPQDGEPAGGWPTLGSFASYVHGSAGTPYVDASPKMSYRPYNNRGIHDASGKSSWPGFTGRQHIPLTLEGEVKNDLVLQGIEPARLQTRRQLLEQLDRSPTALGAMSPLQQQAFGMLTSSRLAEALDLSRENARTLERYGGQQPTDSSFGGAPQSPHHLLLARRLVEAGVRCVTVAFGAWDWHANREGTIEYLSKKYLPVFDQAISALLEDLRQRGLSDRVSVVVWGEFGRTPRINAKGGRDHWPGTQSVLLAGGGIQGGRVIGDTDRNGGVPIHRPVHVQEVFATLYKTLQMDVNTIKVPDLNGRPRYLVDDNRQPIGELYA